MIKFRSVRASFLENKASLLPYFELGIILYLYYSFRDKNFLYYNRKYFLLFM